MHFSAGREGWNECLDYLDGCECGRLGGGGGGGDIDSQRDVFEWCGGIEEDGEDLEVGAEVILKRMSADCSSILEGGLTILHGIPQLRGILLRHRHYPLRRAIANKIRLCPDISTNTSPPLLLNCQEGRHTSFTLFINVSWISKSGPSPSFNLHGSSGRYRSHNSPTGKFLRWMSS